jgi:hypothetical protein
MHFYTKYKNTMECPQVTENKYENERKMNNSKMECTLLYIYNNNDYHKAYNESNKRRKSNVYDYTYNVFFCIWWNEK